MTGNSVPELSYAGAAYACAPVALLFCSEILMAVQNRRYQGAHKAATQEAGTHLEINLVVLEQMRVIDSSANVLAGIRWW